jgi:hypothetical protein
VTAAGIPSQSVYLDDAARSVSSVDARASLYGEIFLVRRQFRMQAPAKAGAHLAPMLAEAA